MNMNYETSISSPINSAFLEVRDEQDIQRKRRWIIIGAVVSVLILGAAFAMYFMGSARENAASAAKAKEGQAQSVTVIAPGLETVVRAINATGTLAARREVPVGVVGEGGQVSHVYVDAGDWVRQGQVMASIDRSVQVQQAAALEAQIGVARADAQLAQNELDRALQLVQRGFISKADVDRKTSARDSARARVNVANAQLSETRARNARLDIRAPVAGYVLERTVQVGQTVAGGSGTLFRLAKDGEMELQAQLGESDLASVSEGVPATITPVGDTRQYNGQIWQVSPVINPETRQGIARIALPFDRALRPGGFASVEIKAGTLTAPILPESAVQNDANGAFVFIVGKGNKVERRTIKTGTVTANGLAIMEGLDGTERVVLYSGGFLNPGETINPTTKKKTP
jgi:HlyD family secretion protein